MQNELKIPFSPVTGKDWIQKVMDDIKGKKSMEDFIRKYEELELDLFVTASNSKQTLLPLDRLFSETLSGIYLNISDDNKDQQNIIRFLEKGANALFLQVKKVIKPEVLFANIHLDYIFVCMVVNDTSQSNLITEYIEKKYKNSSLDFFIICKDKVVFPDKTITTEIQMNKGMLDSMATALNQLYYEILAEKPFRGLIQLVLGKDMLLSISAVRAFRILWENLVSYAGFEGDIPPVIICRPDTSCMSDDANQSLIELSYMTLSGILGNTDICLSDFPQGHSHDEYLSKAFLVQQIFREEGRLFQVKDPVAGSFFIEQATQKIAENVWEKFLSGR
jgi:predicted CopG family antitoxin